MATKSTSDGQGDHRVTYAPRSDATPDGELTALAHIYRYLLDHRERCAVAAADGAEKVAEGSDERAE
jgi:hypothetical protein